MSKLDQDEHCSYGLEQLQSIQHLQHLKARQSAIVQAVLSEQRWQKLLDRHDPVSLQMISSSFSRVSVENAIDRAVIRGENSNAEGQDSRTLRQKEADLRPITGVYCAIDRVTVNAKKSNEKQKDSRAKQQKEVGLHPLDDLYKAIGQAIFDEKNRKAQKRESRAKPQKETGLNPLKGICMEPLPSISAPLRVSSAAYRLTAEFPV